MDYLRLFFMLILWLINNLSGKFNTTYCCSVTGVTARLMKGTSLDFLLTNSEFHTKKETERTNSN